MTGPDVVLARAVAVHHRLLAAGIDNAIGGALALGYHIDDPRGTQDIDVNVSAEASRAAEVLKALPVDVPWDASTVAAIERDEQVRIMWPVEGEFPMPLDLFFMAGELHETVRQRAVTVPMQGAEVRILSATDLTIFKSLFDRPKDWVDIRAMLDAHDSSVDVDDASRWVESIVGEGDQRAVRLRNLSKLT